MPRYSIASRAPGQPRKIPSQPSQTQQDFQRALGGLGLGTQVASLAGFDVPYSGPLLGLLGLATVPEGKRGEEALKLGGKFITSPEAAKLAATFLPQGISGAGSMPLLPSTIAEIPFGQGHNLLPGLRPEGFFGPASAGISSGIGLIDQIGPMGFWAVPQLADTLFNFINGNETAIRRAKRTGTARTLGGQILNPESLSASIGGSNAGEALAAMLKYNQDATWFTDTSHNWLPDPALRPLQQRLTSLGYTGAAEPRQGDVGGVGEIVASYGNNAWEGAQVWENVLRSLSSRIPGQRFSLVSPLVGWQESAPEGGLLKEVIPDTGSGAGNQTMLTDDPSTSYSMVLPPNPTGTSPGQTVVVPDTSGGEGGNQTFLLPPELSPEYLAALGDPELENKVAAAFQAKQDNAWAVFDAYHNVV